MLSMFSLAGRRRGARLPDPTLTRRESSRSDQAPGSGWLLSVWSLQDPLGASALGHCGVHANESLVSSGLGGEVVQLKVKVSKVGKRFLWVADDEGVCLQRTQDC